MPEYENDPAGSTQQFRAYVQRGAADPATAAKGGSAGLIIGVAAVVVIVAVVAGLVVVAL
jgi:hypothetical protein